VNAVAPPRAAHDVNTPIALVVSVALTALVLVFLFPNLWYGLNSNSANPLYQSYAQRMADGERPFTATFEMEYPPLAVPVFRLPGHSHDLNAYVHWFTIWMGVLTLITAAITATVACRYWPRGGRAYVAAVLFPVGVALTGALIVNRYDAAVALLIAIFILCLWARWLTAAAFVLGMGFALKLTPAALLPLVLILAGRPRRWAWPIVAFGAAALAPFLPYLLSSPRGLWYVFQYHLERPLQIESVLGTPMLFGKLLGLTQATWGWSHGSHSLVARGAGLAANASGALTLLALAGVYLLVWRRRERLRATAPDQAIAVLALILALLAFGKVLSPQYFIYTLPAWALVAARDRALAILGGFTLLLTQVEYPALFGRFLDMRPESVALVVTRNTLLVVFFAVAAWRLWGLPDEDAPAEVTGLRAGSIPRRFRQNDRSETSD